MGRRNVYLVRACGRRWLFTIGRPASENLSITRHLFVTALQPLGLPSPIWTGLGGLTALLLPPIRLKTYGLLGVLP